MYPTGGSGDLSVTIKESDGSEQNLIVPYASLPVLQREGRLKYSVTSGVYRAYDNSIDETPLTQGTAIYGLPLGITLYGGGQFSSKYQSWRWGWGKPWRSWRRIDRCHPCLVEPTGSRQRERAVGAYSL